MMKVVYGEVPEREVIITTTEYGAKFLAAVLRFYIALNPDCGEATLRAADLLDEKWSWQYDSDKVDKLFR